jgi:hypothetical protein
MKDNAHHVRTALPDEDEWGEGVQGGEEKRILGMFGDERVAVFALLSFSPPCRLHSPTIALGVSYPTGQNTFGNA